MSNGHFRPPVGGHHTPAGRHRAPASGPAADQVVAITALRAALADRSVTCTRIKVVDDHTAMLVAGERIVLYRHSRFWWATGRFRAGRAILATHDAADPHGAARRLTRPAADPDAARTAGGSGEHRSGIVQA